VQCEVSFVRLQWRLGGNSKKKMERFLKPIDMKSIVLQLVMQRSLTATKNYNKMITFTTLLLAQHFSMRISFSQIWNFFSIPRHLKEIYIFVLTLFFLYRCAQEKNLLKIIFIWLMKLIEFKVSDYRHNLLL